MININLVQEIGDTIDLRESVMKINDSLSISSNEKKIILDFQGIKFVSRAAADQLLKLKKNLAERMIDIEFENMPDNIKEMISQVSLSYTNSSMKRDYQFQQIKSQEKLAKLLSSVFPAHTI